MIFEYELLSDEEIREHIRNCEGKHVQQVSFSTYMDCITQICFTEQKIRSGIKWNGNKSIKLSKKDINEMLNSVQNKNTEIDNQIIFNYEKTKN